MGRIMEYDTWYKAQYEAEPRKPVGFFGYWAYYAKKMKEWREKNEQTSKT